MSELWRPSVTVAAVIERGGRFLLVEEEIEGRRVLNQPAGHLDPGESLLAACRREVLEETAHHFAPRALVGIYRWRHAPKDGSPLVAQCVRDFLAGRRFPLELLSPEFA